MDEVSDVSDNSIQGSPLLETEGWGAPESDEESFIGQMMPSRNPNLLRRAQPLEHKVRPMSSIGESFVSSLTSESTKSNETRPLKSGSASPERVSLPREPVSTNLADEELPFTSLPLQQNKNTIKERPKSMFDLSDVAGKVISKDSYENYRKSMQLDLNRVDSVIKPQNEEDSDSDSDGDVYHEKAEKRQLAKDRQKQEARLSVWRQSMMKFTGTTPQNHQDFNTIGQVPVEEDSDDLMDDIPLSILRAHGFPKDKEKEKEKNRQSNLVRNSVVNGGIQPVSQNQGQSQGQPQTQAQEHRPTQRESLFRDSTADIGGVRQARSSYFDPRGSVFEDKNAPVSRGLVAQIAKEKELRKRRTFDPNFAALDGERLQTMQSMQSSTSLGPQPQPEIGELHNRMDVIIQMLANMNGQPMNSPSMTNGIQPSQSFVGFGSANAPSLRSAPSVRSMNTINTTPGFSPNPQTATSYSPDPRMSMYSNFTGTFASRPASSRPMSIRSYAPTTTSPLGGLQNTPPMPPPHKNPTEGYRPSRLRLVQQEEEEDDEQAMNKLIEQRNARKQQWTQSA